MNQSVIKALKLLNLFTEEKPELSLKQIAAAANLPKSTAFRLLASLERCEFLIKTKESEHDSRYRLGLKLLELGHLVSSQLEIRETALPFMEKLAREINEVIHLVVLNQDVATYIEKVDSTRAIRLYTRIGKSSPLYIGSGPKLLLAFLPGEKQNHILHAGELKPLANGMPIDKEALLEELADIRKQGFAYSEGEQDPDTTGVSFPIYDFREEVVAALAVSGLSSHFEGERLGNIKRSAEETAEAISAQLGFRRGRIPERI
ncbi:MAG TPA: IclR family transcriptional regulator [Bacillaceae bacterium]